jgi:hypothetical protein
VRNCGLLVAVLPARRSNDPTASAGGWNYQVAPAYVVGVEAQGLHMRRRCSMAAPIRSISNSALQAVFVLELHRTTHSASGRLWMPLHLRLARYAVGAV